jgi:hypothetical protein
MGLDMYLERMPRYKGATAKDITAVESYLDWLISKAKGSEHANCSFKEWCGIEKTPCKTYVEFYVNHYKAYYSDYDKEHKHPWMRIKEEVGYWRKANHIHNWFVENIQNGEDDCEYHRELTEEDLRELLSVCKKVIDSCELIDGKVANGYKYENGTRFAIWEDGQYVKDPSVAEELLPSCSGFFFGSTNYDQYYVEDVKKTIDIINKVLETTDFDKQMIYYVSSW